MICYYCFTTLFLFLTFFLRLFTQHTKTTNKHLDVLFRTVSRGHPRVSSQKVQRVREGQRRLEKVGEGWRKLEEEGRRRLEFST